MLVQRRFTDLWPAASRRIRRAQDDDDDEPQVISARRIPPIRLNQHLDLGIGSDVELDDGSFLRIKSAHTDFSGREAVRGKRLLPHTAEQLLMPEMEGELTWVMRFEYNTEEHEKEYAVPISRIVRNCKIYFTNQKYSELNVSHIHPRGDGKPHYFCRWKCSLPPVDPKKKPEDSYRHKIGKIERLREQEADCSKVLLSTMQQVPLRLSDHDVRRRWRGADFADWMGSDKRYELNDAGDFNFTQKYTFGDSFCGAGGTTCGAVQAGLSPKWAFDLDEAAINTYMTNFGDKGAAAAKVHVSDFLAAVAARQWLGNFFVDIIHLSPPCQPFSPANTTPNELLNEANRAALTSVDDILRMCKPRLATLEEAAGMEHPRHQGWLRKMVTMFIDNGYSVRWKIVNLKVFGVPQTRDRLIVIAAGPGEKLPSFLSPTHGSEAGLRPFPSIYSSIRDIDPLAVDHDMPRPFDVPKRPIDAFGLAGTITTGGGGDNVYHPSGLRAYTVRELACLQTFPREFMFAGTPTQQRRQIGNAVPPVFAKALFGHLRSCLEKADLEEIGGVRL